MRRILLAAFGLSGAALVSAAITVPHANAAPPPRLLSSQATAQAAGPAAARTCYAQVEHDALVYIPSQNFEAAFDAYDTQAADDFVLTRPCRHPVLFIDGTYGEGVVVADSFNVTIYRATNRGPGEVERQRWNLPFTEPCGVGFGCTQITLRKTLPPGHWWLSVQANLDAPEQWRWWTNLSIRNTGAMWQNPRDGFATGCTTYTDLVTCLGAGSGVGRDLSFSISSS